MTNPVIGYLTFHLLVATAAFLGMFWWRFLKTFWDGEPASPAKWALTFMAPAVWPISLIVVIVYTVYVSTKECRK